MPKMHQFKYKMHWHLIDLNDMNKWENLSYKHAMNGFSVYSLFDKDYVDSSDDSINLKIHRYLTEQHVLDCDRIVLMTHPRYFGFSFNSVSFYFCYSKAKLVAIVSEINNTPWGEKQLYCHDLKTLRDDHVMVFKFKKEFHISPFVPMDVDYVWTFDVSDIGIHVDMKLYREQSLLMRVNLNTRTAPACSPKWYHFGMGQALKMWSAIYWQAAVLLLKKVPFHDHPQTNQAINDKPAKSQER